MTVAAAPSAASQFSESISALIYHPLAKGSPDTVNHPRNAWFKEGSVQLYPNLVFDGRCEAAFKFYEEWLQGKIVFMMTYENTPMNLQTPPDWGKKISHATFAHADFTLYGSDVPPERYQKPQGFALQFNLADAVEGERIFNALAKNGNVQMPLQETFWALRFGVLTDQFGIPWVINCEKQA